MGIKRQIYKEIVYIGIKKNKTKRVRVKKNGMKEKKRKYFAGLVFSNN